MQMMKLELKNRIKHKYVLKILNEFPSKMCF